MGRQRVRIDQLVVPPDTPENSVPTVVGGELVYGAGGSGSSALVPLTTVINGVPQLVWDADNNLVMTEVPR